MAKDRYEDIAEKILSEIHGVKEPGPPPPPIARVNLEVEPRNPIIISYDELGRLH